MATPTIQVFGQTAGSQYRHAQIALMAAKGIADDNIYPVSLDPVTGAIAVSPSTLLNFGDPTNAPRSASMLGSVDYAGAYGPVFRSPEGNLQTAGLINEDYRATTHAYPSATQETIEVYRDALKTLLICTITIDYADATKQRITSMTRT